jgi:hypothetical protein
LLPCNFYIAPSTFRWIVLYSDDDGATWSESAAYGGAGGTTYANETAIVEEGSSKHLAAYVRTQSANGSGTFTPAPRYTSSDGVTWVESGSINVPTADNRFQAKRLENGLVAVIGNDSYTDYSRIATTIWLLGEGGAVVGKIPVYGEFSGGQNYPSITARGEELAVVMPVRENTLTDTPAKTIVITQSIADWVKNTRDRDRQGWLTLGANRVADADYYTTAIATGAAVSMTSASGGGVGSISLPAGTWFLEGNVNFNLGSASVTELIGYIVTSGVPTDGTEVQTHINTTVLSGKAGVTIPRKRITLTATTTVYLAARATFSTGTVTAYGSMTASRQ